MNAGNMQPPLWNDPCMRAHAVVALVLKQAHVACMIKHRHVQQASHHTSNTFGTIIHRVIMTTIRQLVANQYWERTRTARLMVDHVVDAGLVRPRFREAPPDAMLSPALRRKSRAAAGPRRLALASFCIAQAL